MTAEEQKLLEGLTARVNQTVLADKDPEAEQALATALGRNPDALYILAQTVIVQQYALDQAKQQLDQTRQQLEDLRQQQAQPAAQKHTSFLGSLFGSQQSSAESTGTPAPPPPAGYRPVANVPPPSSSPYPPVSYPPQPWPQPGYPPSGYAQPGFGGSIGGGMMGGGSFLRSAAQTAAGVAAGALAFEGIESLLHGFGNHAGYGDGFGAFGGGPREEIVNNYYGDSVGERHSRRQ